MNITPRIKSARNRNNLIVNVSIEIPLKPKLPISHRSQQTSISPSPNKHKKKYKLISSSTYQKKTLNTSNLNTMRDIPYANVEHPPSRKKYSNPTPFTAINQSNKVAFTKFKSCDLSPKKKSHTSRKGKETKITRNISILQRTINQQDNIIKYTTNSNQLRDKSQDFILIENLARKIDTHISEIDITEIRNIQNSARDNREKHYRTKINDILRTASAKKIQRAWRNYKTKKLIRCYSNDIRNKYLRNINISEEPILTVRSQGVGLKFKKKLPDFAEISAREAETKTIEPAEQKPGNNSKIVKKIQEDSMEKWQGFLEQIKNKKNLNAVLQFSLERSKQLKKQLDKDLFQKQSSPSPSPCASQASSENKKIIKTKKYYQSERQKWRQSIERSNGSIKRQQRVNYFQNQMLRLQNDESESDSSLVHSFDIESSNKQLQQIQNIKLRKKLQIFRNHLPQIGQDKQKESSSTKPLSNRVDIATIIRKKSQSLQKPPQKKPLQIVNIIPKHTVEILQFDVHEDIVQKQSNNSQELIETHRQYRPFLGLQQKQESDWKQRLRQIVKVKDQQTIQVVFEELILQALIQISDSQKLITFIKNIYDKTKPVMIHPIKASPPKKAEGILTNHSSIKEYINFFINYLYQYQMENQIYKNLLKPLGPSPRDVLKYFRGEEIAYDPQSQYVMNIKIFNSHWQYSNDLIYFDKKWDDEKRQAQRVNYLKQLTKVFFRAIFDCFNESLESQRIYGLRGKPYPWSQQRLTVQAPTLKKCLSFAFQRVLKYSLVFTGVLFKDKHHNLDDKTIEDVQQSNMVKLLTIEMADEEPLWLFLQDQLAEIKLQITQHIQELLLKEVCKIIGFGWSRR